MKKPQIRNIIPHFVRDENPVPLAERLSDFHVQIIERRLNQLDLTTEQKLTVLDQIIDNIKSREVQHVTQ